jgi:hypothetical protein
MASTSSSEIFVEKRSPRNGEHFSLGTVVKYLSKGGAQRMANTSKSEIPVERRSPENGDHFE